MLLDMGFSKEPYTLHVPGGHTFGDSGVMCTARDLLVFAKFVLNGDVWKGRRYVGESFMRGAVSKLTDNWTDSSVGLHNHNGYGYYIWTTPGGGFSFTGMGDQLMFCEPEKDKLRIRMQITDTYFGGITWTLCFKDERVTYNVKKTGSRILDGFAGITMGKKK